MLKISNLHVSLEDEDKQILKGVDLAVDAGKVHAIMGPNGSGKSTLSYVLSGKDGYKVTGGKVELNGSDILELDPEERAALGLFLAFQYPIEIPGVRTPLPHPACRCWSLLSGVTEVRLAFASNRAGLSAT